MARPNTLAFLKTESGAGAALAAAALAALLLANSPWSADYFGFIEAPFTVRLGSFVQSRSIASWVRDGLMPLFFLVLGMEIKFELLRGELSSSRRLAVPILAALGGVIGPAVVFLTINAAPGGSPAGWPVTTPTDIALSLAVLAIFAPRLSDSLRLFILTVAVADDLCAVGLIGVLYTGQVSAEALAGAGVTMAALVVLSRWHRAPRLFYAVGFLIVWGFTLQSGVSTSAAAIACALTVPIDGRRVGQDSMLKTFMDGLHPYVAYGVLPLFAFTAAGFSFVDLESAGILSPRAWGVALALLIGKPLGVFAALLLAVAIRLGRRPSGTTWLELAGAALLCGAGFTVSFYIAAQVFTAADRALQAELRAAVIAGSLASALAGGAVLAWAQARRDGRGMI